VPLVHLAVRRDVKRSPRSAAVQRVEWFHRAVGDLDHANVGVLRLRGLGAIAEEARVERIAFVVEDRTAVGEEARPRDGRGQLVHEVARVREHRRGCSCVEVRDGQHAAIEPIAVGEGDVLAIGENEGVCA